MVTDQHHLRLSPLPKTWFLDVDGVLLRHNGHRRGTDEVLAGVVEFAAEIGREDLVVVVTARPEDQRKACLTVLREAGLRVDVALFGMPVGERIVVNDLKPSGLRTAHAVNLVRDEGLSGVCVVIDESL